jgi:malonyl-CoA/methylmalonyl-CoA synthetase
VPTEFESNHNIYARIQQQVARYPDTILLVTETGNSYSYADVDRISSQLAGLLSDRGLTVGDRVSVQVKKSPEALCLYLACLRGGFVFHPLNTGYQAAEMAYFLENADPKLVVCDNDKQTVLQPLVDRLGISTLLTLNADGSGTLLEQCRGRRADFAVVARAPNDLAALLYSSGTTGVPKGIMLSHHNLCSNAESLVQVWEFQPQDILLHALPIFHVHGLFVALHCVLFSGASMRWLAEFNVEQVIDALPQCTVFMGVPTYYTRLLASERFGAAVCRHMRVFISGSAPLLQETFHDFNQRTGHRILERYGMTETAMNTSNPLDGLRKPGTVGLPLPGVELRVCDQQQHALPQGAIGNLQVRGPNVFQGYWRLPEKTAEDFTADGFFNTGDKGMIDAEGYVVIVGRAKDMVISGGLNVYPKEIEQVIDALPGVVESAVIGVPHSDFGEAVVAVVVVNAAASLTEADIIESVKTLLANFKVPKRVVFVDALPRNSMGKVQKNELRGRYASLAL